MNDAPPLTLDDIMGGGDHPSPTFAKRTTPKIKSRPLGLGILRNQPEIKLEERKIEEEPKKIKKKKVKAKKEGDKEVKQEEEKKEDAGKPLKKKKSNDTKVKKTKKTKNNAKNLENIEPVSPKFGYDPANAFQTKNHKGLEVDSIKIGHVEDLEKQEVKDQVMSIKMPKKHEKKVKKEKKYKSKEDKQKEDKPKKPKKKKEKPAPQQVELDPTLLALRQSKQELKGYKEDIMQGLNVITYLNDRTIPLKNKLIYCWLLLLLIGSYVTNFIDFIFYATSSCTDTEEEYSPVPMYFNFIMLLFVKLGVYNYITSEINSTLQYDLKFPFFIPIIATGVIANYQLPLILFNYRDCSLRSPVFKVSVGYFIVSIIAVVTAIAFFIMALSLVFTPKRINLSHEKKRMFRTVFYFICICCVLVLNCLFIFISLSQADKFSPSLLTENLLFWFMVVIGLVIYILRRRYNIEVFKMTKSEDNKKNHEEFQGLIVHGGDISHRDERKETKKELEKIDEKMDESADSAHLPHMKKSIEPLNIESAERFKDNTFSGQNSVRGT